MSPDTTFRICEPSESDSIEHAISSVDEMKFDQETAFAEGTGVSFEATSKEFELDQDGARYRFSLEGLLSFCATIGIPRAFAEKVPNSLLVTNINEMLDASDKTKIKYIRRGPVIVRAMRPTRAWLHPKSVIENAAEGLKERGWGSDRVTVMDDGVVLNAYEANPTTFRIKLPEQEDTYDVGVGMDYGVGRPGLLVGRFITRNHRCRNIAHLADQGDLRKLCTYERIRSTDPKPATYRRFHERCTGPAEYVEALTTMHSRLLSQPLMDVQYLSLQRSLARVIGKESSLSQFGMDEDSHEVIVQDVKARTLMAELPGAIPREPFPVRQVQLYKTFNRVTALAHGYHGIDKLHLEQIGGAFLALSM